MVTKEDFKKALSEATLKAEIIAGRVKYDSTLYVQPEVEKWIADYAQSVLFGNKSGLFEQFEIDALKQYSTVFGEVGVQAITSQDLEREPTGNREMSEAVFNQLDIIRTRYKDSRVDQNFLAFDQAISNRNQADAYYIYDSFFKLAFLDVVSLGNSMLKKMAQGDKPAPTAGPGQHSVHTPFGDVIVNDTPLEQEKVGNITVAQLRQILAGK